jgi:hypothetical protein
LTRDIGPRSFQLPHNFPDIRTGHHSTQNNNDHNESPRLSFFLNHGDYPGAGLVGAVVPTQAWRLGAG